MRAQSNILPNFSTKATAYSRRSFARSASVFSREVASSQGGREGEVAGTAGDRGPPAVGPPAPVRTVPRRLTCTSRSYYASTYTTCTGLDLQARGNPSSSLISTTCTIYVRTARTANHQFRQSNCLRVGSRASTGGCECSGAPVSARALFVSGNQSPLFRR